MPFKRPFAAIGGITLLSMLMFSSIALWGATLAVCLVFALLSRKLRKVLLVSAAIFAVAGGIAGARSLIADLSTARLDGNNAYIQGYVCEIPTESEFGTQYTLRLETAYVGGESISLRSKAKVWLDSGFKADVYERITLSADVTAVPLLERDDGVAYKLYATDAPRISGEAPHMPYYYCLRLKQFMLKNLSADGENDNSGLLSALLLGDKSEVSADTQLAFRSCGVSHLMVVSGLHIVTIAMFIFEILRRLLRRPPIAITLVAVWLLVALTAFSASAVRAAVMLTIVFGAGAFGREADSLNSLGFAAFVMCLINPGTARNVGFLLSVSATAGLIILSPRIGRRILNFCRVSRQKTSLPLYAIISGVVEVIAQSVAAWIATLPVTVLCFGSVSLVSPIANLLTLTPAAITLTLGFPAALIPFLGRAFLRLSFVGARWLIWITDMLSRIPFSYTYVAYPYMIAALVAIAAAVIAVKRKLLRPTLALPLAVSVLFCGICSYYYATKRVMQINSVYVGSARADFVSCDGSRILYIAGLDKDSCDLIVSRASRVGIFDVDVIAVGDAYSLDAAAKLGERLKADSVFAPIAVTAEGATSVSEATASLGNAEITFVSSGVRLDMYAKQSEALLAFTSRNLLEGDYGAVFGPVGYKGNGVLVTGARSQYYERTDKETIYTCDEGILTFYCNGKDLKQD